MKIFCQDCGAKIEYSDNPPNFCQSCGYNLKGSITTNEEIDTRESSASSKNANSYTSLAGLEVDVEKQENTKFSLGEVINQYGMAGSQNVTPEEFNFPSKEETLDQIQKEAKTLREKK